MLNASIPSKVELQMLAFVAAALQRELQVVQPVEDEADEEQRRGQRWERALALQVQVALCPVWTSVVGSMMVAVPSCTFISHFL